MKKFFTLLAFASIMASCTRIDSSKEALEVSQYGNDKGTPIAVPVKGMVFYNPFTKDIYEYPVSMRHVQYKQVEFTTSDGSPFTASPMFNYTMKPGSAVDVFLKYRKDIDDIEDEFMAACVLDVYVRIGNSFTADSLMSSRALFEDRMMKELVAKLGDDFTITQLVSNMQPPQALVEAITNKNKLVQDGLAEMNKVVKANAAADVKIADARGDAEAKRINVDAEAYANAKKQSTLTPMLLQQLWIEAWKSGGAQVPNTMTGTGSQFLLSLPK